MLRTVDLEVQYPNGTRALEPTSLTFDRGALTVLLGPSGAGKSTLLRALGGLVAPSAGHVIDDDAGDANTPAARRRHRRRSAMVFQQHHLIGRISTLDNVLLGRLGFHSGLRTLWPFSQIEKILALQALDRVGLLETANRRADTLSGGQQQRVGIARALVQQPAIILADEPVASLDPIAAKSILQLLHDVCKQDDIATIVSLHQLPFALAFADRIVGLSAGRVVFDGTPAHLGESALACIYGAAMAKDTSQVEAIIEQGTHHAREVAAN
ncbi:MAG: phosphonate ABC transporter ATP-binding protein [Burkholderiales bacterium]